MPTPFVVYASMRTGSRWLVELLDSHPGAAVYSEAFLANGEGSMTSSGGSFPYFVTYLAARRVRRPLVLQRVRYLRAFFRHVPDARAVGFKLMYGQAERNPGVLHYSALRRIRAIHVVRRNALHAVVSHRVALESGPSTRAAATPSGRCGLLSTWPRWPTSSAAARRPCKVPATVSRASACPCSR